MGQTATVHIWAVGMITANLATYSGRKDSLPKTVQSLRNQAIPFDKIRVYANDYRPDLEGVEIVTGPDLTDNGKFYFMRPGELYFSCDDDLIYPPFYVEYMLEKLSQYPECFISMHGRKLLGKGLNYYRGHHQYHCLRNVDEDLLIDVPGTGVGLCNTDHFRFDVTEYDERKMSDVLVGLEAARQGVDVVCVAHSMWWLKGLDVGETIYHEKVNDCQRQSELCDIIWDEKY